MDTAMDTPLSGERVAEEKAFVARYTDSLKARKIEYPADYAPPLESRPRRVPVLHTAIAPPPDVEGGDGEQHPDATVNLTVKCVKPALTIPVRVHLSDSVADLKAAIVAANPSAPPPPVQRLLLKGKALADSKLIKEYDVADGAVLNLMAKSGAPAVPAPAPSVAAPVPISPTKARGKHVSTPSLTITTEPGGEPQDAYEFARASPEPASPVASVAFHRTLSNTDFWSKIYGLCQEEFGNEAEAKTVFDTFLVSMKSRLSASEAAKIRDVVGVDGMGGGTY